MPYSLSLTGPRATLERYIMKSYKIWLVLESHDENTDEYENVMEIDIENIGETQQGQAEKVFNVILDAALLA